VKTRTGVAFVLFALGACTRVQHVENETPSPLPSPTPEASPTPIYVPQKRIETAKLFNGIELHSTFESQPGGTATTERNAADSYTLELKLHVNVPKPNSDLQKIAELNDALPKLLPALDKLVISGKTSPFFENFYRFKLATLQQNLPRLDQLLSRHNFYDCETMLELQEPNTKRRALFIQADMDIDTDGSDGDRIAPVDTESPTFQALTSYKWTKKTLMPNPLLASREAKLKQLEAAAKAPNATRELRDQLGAIRYEIAQLKTNSFLVATADPYVVLPGWMLQSSQPFTPRVGDYCVVIYKDVLYPAIIGDVGPRDKIGEASLRIGKELNARATADNRPVSALKVTYLIFPNSSDKPFAAPDLGKWWSRCEELLNEIGGHTGELHAWPDVTKPAPTPTPTPSPTPASAPSASPDASP